jgi:antitoxin HigA-1
LICDSQRDERTSDFGRGKRVKAFSGIEHSAPLKLDRLEAATSILDLAALPGNRFEALKGKRKGQYSRSFMPKTAIHPGEHLAEELEALGMSAAGLARQLKVPTNRITGILNGQRAITGDTALRLGHFFGNNPQFWLNLQSLYELRLAEQKAGKAIKILPTLKKQAPAHA